MAGLSVLWAAHTLPRLDRARLGSGAQLASAAMSSALWLDPALLTGVLEVRRWRRVGRVRSRDFRRGPPAFLRVPGVPRIPRLPWALLRGECVRALRRPGALAVWASLALLQYAVAVAAPSLAGVARLVLAYLAAGRLTPGLRTVARSSALRRALGGNDRLVRGVHLVLPALMTLVWWLVTMPAGADGAGPAGALLVAGVVAAAYRGATRPPMTYDGAVVETPFGLLPLGLVLQLARGPDLLGAVILVRIFL